MANNPLLTILKGIKDFEKQVDSGDFSNFSPEFKERFDKMTPQEKEKYKKEFKKQAKENTELSNAMGLLKDKMKEFNNIRKNATN